LGRKILKLLESYAMDVQNSLFESRMGNFNNNLVEQIMTLSFDFMNSPKG
jgi:CRISPR/Cas system-associated endoribonuclease Cas2